MTSAVRTFTLLVALASGCSKSESPPPSPAPAPSAASKDAAAARKMIEAGAVVLDVRTPAEYSEAHLPAATNIPVQQFSERIAEVEKLVGGDKARPIVVYCASGARSAKAKAQLDAAGYTNVVNGGGYDDLH